MRRWLAAGMLATARFLIRSARYIYPPTVTYIDGTGQRWILTTPERGRAGVHLGEGWMN